mgnify:CR=1 FL=1
MVKIVLDAFGGDNAPHEIVKGGVLALQKFKDIKIIFAGDEDKIKEILAESEYPFDRVEIIDAKEVIENNEIPTVAFKAKPNSSLVRAFDELRTNDEAIGFVGAGSTGAVLTAGFLKIGRLTGISRPALCPILPTVNNKHVAIIDCGANMDAKPINLLHFAIMGSAYLSTVYGVKSPRVALLNVGVEEYKGNELSKETYELLSKQPRINFVGNMEARELLSGNYEVVVADGFNGNVLLKGTEGAVVNILKMIKGEIKKKNIRKVGAVFMKGAFKALKKKMNYEESGGAVLIGCKKIVLKSHGNSTAKNICASIEQVLDMHQSKLIEKISQEIEKG